MAEYPAGLLGTRYPGDRDLQRMVCFLRDKLYSRMAKRPAHEIGLEEDGCLFYGLNEHLMGRLKV